VKKIVRNMSTPESRAFWERIERSALEIQHWPAWRRAGINVSQFRQEPREASDDATSCDLTSDE
jgi:hypothetical protein